MEMHLVQVVRTQQNASAVLVRALIVDSCGDTSDRSEVLTTV